MTSPAAGDFDAVLVDARRNPPEPVPHAIGSTLDDWWSRLSSGAQSLIRWGAPALVLLVAAVTRLVNLGHPNVLVFDETFYVKDAWTLVNLGYEGSWPAESDGRFAAGQTDIYYDDPSFVVHPPLAKLIIGLGMMLLGSGNPVGWRITTAIVGILAVALIMVIAHLLFKSMVLTTIAGFILAIEGNAIVMSRVALLDNYVMFFALLGFAAILLDRRFSAVRLSMWIAAREARERSIDWGPALWWRPWLFAAGAAFGAATAVKWSGLYFLAAFAVYTLVVDALARRRAGIRFWVSSTVFKQAPVSFLLTVPVAAAVYLASWIGWFSSSNGYSRNWASEPGNAWEGALAWVPTSIQSFWHFESSVYAYHVGEMRPHGYQANPLTWLLLIRPTSMWYQGSVLGENGCDFQNCGASITGLANPLIWWAATAAAVYLVYRLVRFREWRVGLILLGLGAGYLPWLLYLNRTVFQFYTIAFEPYLVLGLTLTIGIILGTRRDPRDRRVSGIWVVTIFLTLATLASVFFWPLWTGMQLDYNYLRLHWWFDTWR